MLANKKRKKNAEAAANELINRMANIIVTWILVAQQRFTEFLNRRTRNYSVKKWKVLICLFVIVWGSGSLYCAATAFRKSSLKLVKTVHRLHVTTGDTLRLMERIYKDIHQSK